MSYPEIKTLPTDKVSPGGKPPNTPPNNAESQNTENTMRRDTVKEKVYATEMKPGNSQMSLSELLLCYLAFLYKVLGSKKESDDLLKALEKLREEGAYSARKLIALDNDDILLSKGFTWMLGVVYFRLAIPDFKDAPLDVNDEERGEIIISIFLKKFEEKYDNVELRNLLRDLLKYNNDERLELEDLQKRLETMYEKILEKEKNTIGGDNSVNLEPQNESQALVIIEEAHPCFHPTPAKIKKKKRKNSKTKKAKIKSEKADFVNLATPQITDNSNPEQTPNQVSPSGLQGSAQTPEEGFLRPPVEISVRTPSPNGSNPSSRIDLHPLFERIRVTFVRLIPDSNSNENQTHSESNAQILLSQILENLSSISQDNSRISSTPSFSENLSSISRNYQDSLSSLEELRTILVNSLFQLPPELANHPIIPDNHSLLSSSRSEETSTKMCDSKADLSSDYFSLHDMNSTATGSETLHELTFCSEPPWMDSVEREFVSESFVKCKRGPILQPC